MTSAQCFAGALWAGCILGAYSALGPWGAVAAAVVALVASVLVYRLISKKEGNTR